MYKKIIYLLSITLFLVSCDTMSEVKRGLSGEKKMTTDEFFIQKKDPLILPPNYENLPTPDEKSAFAEEVSSFEKNLENSIEEEVSTSSGSIEESILKKIKKN